MKVLIVKLTSLGDVLFALSIVGDLARYRPDVQVDWVVDKSFADLVSSCRGVRRVWPLPFRALGKRFQLRSLGRSFRTLWVLRAEKYDCVIDLQGMIKSSVVALLARGAIRWNYRRDLMAEPLFCSFFDRFFDSSKTVPALENYRNIGATVFGYAPVGQPDFMLGAARAAQSSTPQLAELPTIALQAGLIPPFVVVFPFASKSSKVIPHDQVIRLLEAVKQALPRHQVAMLAGSESERNQALAYSKQSAVLAIPRLSLGDTIRLIAVASGFLGADTGLTYIAAAVGVPTVAIFASTDPSVLNPAIWASRASAVSLSEPEWMERALSVLVQQNSGHDSIS
ncbi:MAG: lipopolysaccharide heptosyltransferase I [Burkholderiaceae bacterium]|nr:lipopolysaccharide heptosyltransferase I [Burkholderiaceae bacterium]